MFKLVSQLYMMVPPILMETGKVTAITFFINLDATIKKIFIVKMIIQIIGMYIVNRV